MNSRAVVVVPLNKVRNPLVVAAMFRRAGEHRKSNKSIRKQENQRLRGYRD